MNSLILCCDFQLVVAQLCHCPDEAVECAALEPVTAEPKGHMLHTPHMIIINSISCVKLVIV